MASIPTITTIQKEECIGNSLVTINANYASIRESLTDLIRNDLQLINNRLDELTTFRQSLSSEQLAKAWVTFSGNLNTNFSPSFTQTNRWIYSKYNISNVLRNGAGDYTINLAARIGNPQFPTRFTVVGTCSPRPIQQTATGPSNSQPPPGVNTGVVNQHWETDENDDGNDCRIIVKDLLGNSIDPSFISVVVYQSLDLAPGAAQQ